jgi:RimJ/RimL family protein N-acetyltransferase
MIKLLEDYEVNGIFDIISDPEIIQNLTEDVTQVTARTLPSFLLRTLPGTISAAYAIYSDDELAGIITLNNISLIKRSAFIGFIATKKGVKPMCGINASRAIIKHCFGTLGLNRVYGHTWADNERMDGFYKRLGATLEGIEREHTFKNGKFVDMKIWSILRKEYYGTSD